jgi:hypothetical protein
MKVSTPWPIESLFYIIAFAITVAPSQADDQCNGKVFKATVSTFMLAIPKGPANILYFI